MSYLHLEDLIQAVVFNGAEETHHLGLEVVVSKEIWVETLVDNKWQHGLIRGTLVTVDKDSDNIFYMVKCNKEKKSLQLQGPTHMDMVTMVKCKDIHLHLLQVPMMRLPCSDL